MIAVRLKSAVVYIFFFFFLLHSPLPAALVLHPALHHSMVVVFIVSYQVAGGDKASYLTHTKVYIVSINHNSNYGDQSLHGVYKPQS